MEIKEVVDKLIGDTSAHGCASRDKESLINLINKINLVYELILDLQFLARNKDSHEHSVKMIGEKADNFLKNLKDEL